MQKSFLDGIEANIGKVVAYKDFLAQKIIEFRQKENWQLLKMRR